MTFRRETAEPPFNAPWVVLAVVASILGGYLLQSLAPDPDAVIEGLGLSPLGLAQGRVWELVTVLVVHGSWTHALLNAVGALAFATPVARWFGRAGAGRFFTFYIVCGVASSQGYVAMHWGRPDVLVGASGAISGLMGASSRLLDGRGGLAPFRSRTVIGMAAAWGFINLLMAFRWVNVGTGGAPVAWEAHLYGYVAGLLLIGPFTPRSSLARESRP